MALKGHLIAGQLVGPLAGIESGSANDLVGFDGSAVAGTRSLSNLLDAVVGTTQGAIIYRNSTVWTKLDPGTFGQYLKTQGASANPIWADLPPTTGRLVAGTPLVMNPVSMSTTSSPQAHGLGVMPVYIKFEMECLSNEVFGYSAGDKVIGGLSEGCVTILADATNLTLVTLSFINVVRTDTHSSFGITASKWKITLTPYSLT